MILEKNIGQMKKDLYLYTHLGLGDHIICNGMVRELSNMYKLKIFVKNRNYDSVEFMFRDIDVDIIGLEDDAAVERYIYDNKIRNIIRVGFNELYKYLKDYNFDEAFYKQMGIDFSKRWSSFFIQRDIEREKNLFNSKDLVSGEYVFLHDDKSRGYNINMKYLTTDLPIVTPTKEDGVIIFDYIYIIENAAEIHCMDSSFRLIVDSLKGLKTSDIFYHTYVRGNSNTNVSNSKLNWKKIKI